MWIFLNRSVRALQSVPRFAKKDSFVGKSIPGKIFSRHFLIGFPRDEFQNKISLNRINGLGENYEKRKMLLFFFCESPHDSPARVPDKSQDGIPFRTGLDLIFHNFHCVRIPIAFYEDGTVNFLNLRNRIIAETTT